ncbi:MAG: tyrosine-type recombinase/integrase [Planctomycetota bacterium]
MRRYVAEWPYIERGLPLPTDAEVSGVTLSGLLNLWLDDRRQDVDADRLKLATWRQYRDVAEFMVDRLGRLTPVKALRPTDFATLHRAMVKKWGASPSVLSRVVTVARMPFKWGWESEAIPDAVRMGPRFKIASKADKREKRHQRGRQVFTAAEVRNLLDASSVELRAAILLGVNGGYSQREVAEIERDAVDLNAGWIDHLRAKTRQPRRVPLWKETIAAIKALPNNEPEPEAEGLLFVTRNGLKYVREYVNDNDKLIRCDVFGSAFGKLRRSIGIDLDHAGFGKLRATHRTVADAAGDANASQLIMGHALGEGVEEAYIRTIDDDRLVAVVKHVHDWLWPEEGGDAK